MMRRVIMCRLDGLAEREFSTRLTFLECGRTQGRVSREDVGGGAVGTESGE